MIKVYGFPKTRATRISWMLEELGQDYEFCVVNLLAGEGRSPEFLAINPAGKVPALQDGDFVLLESAAIVTYLGDKFPDQQLVPAAGTRERGSFDQWGYFVLSELEQPLWLMGKHRFVLPEDRRVPAIMETAAWEFQRALQLLSEGLGEQEYILGGRFSAADILLGHTLFWALEFHQPVQQANLRDYIDRLKVRPALAAAQQREAEAAPQ